MNVALVMEIIIGGGNTQPLLAVKKFNFLHSQAVEMKKLWVQALDPVTSPDARTKESPAETFTN